MKVPKGLLAAVIVLAALSGGVYWSNKNKAEEATKPASDAPPKILTIADDQFKEVKLEKRDQDPVILSKASGSWELTAPKVMPADQDAVTPLITALANLASDRLIEDKSGDLTGYGLTKPSETITITKKDGKTETVMVGDDTPTQSGAFVKLASDPRIFTIAAFTKTSLDKGVKDLRDKRMLTFNADKMARVTLNAIEFAKTGSTADASSWQILKPKPLRADSAQVDEVVRKMKDAKIDPAIFEEDAKKAQTAFASGAKAATLTVTDPSGTQTLEIRSTGKDKEKVYYGKSSAVEGFWKVSNELGELAGKTVDDFRNKKLFDFGFTDPSKVEVGTFSFTKSGDQWMSGGTRMDSVSVQAVVDKLRDLAATKFVESGGGEVYLVIAVTSSDNKKTEKVSITKKGENYFAVRDGEPGVYQVDGKTVEELQKAASSVKQYTAPKPEPNKPETKKK